MLINLSNHPFGRWEEKQKSMATGLYGSVVDLSFPAVDPLAGEEDISMLVNQYFLKITAIFDECANEPSPNAVHVQGEFTFVCNLVVLLKKSDIVCLASTTIRNVEETGLGEKVVRFRFVRFRRY